MKIQYVKGDAAKADHPSKGIPIVAHVVNDVGAWGKGFTASLDAVSPHPKQTYTQWYRGGINQNPAFNLGNVYLSNLEGDTAPVISPFLVHMLSQHGLRSKDNPVPFDINHFYTCLTKLMGVVFNLGIEASIHMPRVGSGLGGGDWTAIETRIDGVFGSSPYAVYVYDKE